MSGQEKLTCSSGGGGCRSMGSGRSGRNTNVEWRARNLALTDNLFWKQKKNLYSPLACLNRSGSWGLKMIVPGMNLNTRCGFLGGGWWTVGLRSRTRVVTLEQGEVVLTTVEGVSGQLSSQPQVEAGKSNQEDIELNFKVVALLCCSEVSVGDKVWWALERALG